MQSQEVHSQAYLLYDFHHSPKQRVLNPIGMPHFQPAPMINGFKQLVIWGPSGYRMLLLTDTTLARGRFESFHHCLSRRLLRDLRLVSGGGYEPLLHLRFGRNLCVGSGKVF